MPIESIRVRRDTKAVSLHIGVSILVGLCSLWNPPTAFAEPTVIERPTLVAEPTLLSESNPSAEPTFGAEPTSTMTSPRRVGVLFAASCATCHVASESGAPQIGIVADWRPRTKKGRAELLRHTIDGYLDMPPLGSCSGCTLADFRALIELLVPPDAWNAVTIDVDADMDVDVDAKAESQ